MWPRAHGGAPVNSDKLLHYCAWRDVKDIVDQLHTQHPHQPFYLYGVSLGACVATHYLINDREATPVKGAAFYAAPINPSQNAKYFEESLYGLYDHILGQGFVESNREVLERIATLSTKDQALSYRLLLDGQERRTMKNVDRYIFAPMFGFKSEEDFRRNADIGDRLHQIPVPCLYRHAWDDIFLAPDSVPCSEFQTNDKLILATTKRGGHGCHFTQSSYGLLPTMWF